MGQRESQNLVIFPHCFTSGALICVTFVFQSCLTFIVSAGRQTDRQSDRQIEVVIFICCIVFVLPLDGAMTWIFPNRGTSLHLPKLKIHTKVFYYYYYQQQQQQCGSSSTNLFVPSCGTDIIMNCVCIYIKMHMVVTKDHLNSLFYYKSFRQHPQIQ